MKRIFWLSGIASLLFACNNNSGEQISGKTPLVDSIQTSDNQYCYKNAGGSDSIWLQLNLVGTDVSGELLYAIQGKDRNQGSVHGEWLGDTLLLDYMFQSEGTLSSRQVIFIRQDSLLLEGYGASEEVDGKLRFVNRSALSFGSGIRLKQTACVATMESTGVSSTTPLQVEQGSEALYKYQWQLKEVKGILIAEAKRPQFTLLLMPGQPGRVSGRGGCNRISGSFDLSGSDGIKFGAIASTEMACPDMEQEDLFLKSLAEINQWKIVNNELHLLQDGKGIVIFQAVTGKK